MINHNQKVLLEKIAAFGPEFMKELEGTFAEIAAAATAEPAAATTPPAHSP
jgi:hypothetical protein